MRVYHDQDADLSVIKNKKVAIVGYGSQGHAHANNLKESGVENLRVALRPGSRSAQKAEAAGITVVSPEEAAQWADVLMVLVPDELQVDLYNDKLAPNMKQGAALAFAHGFNIHYRLIEPRDDLDVFMIAPKAPGHLVRNEYTRGAGTPALIAVEQNPSGQGHDVALAYAAGLGTTRAGVLETTFQEECETDLFGEQAVLCGGISQLVRSGYETLVEAGYQPEMAYFECLHEVKLIVDLMYEGGLKNVRYSISNTAEFGDYTRGKRVIDEGVKQRMKEVLEEVQSGQFAKEWVLECQAGQPQFKAERRRWANHPLEQIGHKLRAMMPWMKEGKLTD